MDSSAFARAHRGAEADERDNTGQQIRASRTVVVDVSSDSGDESVSDQDVEDEEEVDEGAGDGEEED